MISIEKDPTLQTLLIQEALKARGLYSGDLDNWPGPMTRAALLTFQNQILNNDGHRVKASSFADPADVAAYRRCKAQGNSDEVCFRVGDNGIGKWGDDTAAIIPMCALPPEDWSHLGAAARGAKVLVTANGKSVVCELRDTMPHRANITNGAGIDLNPAAVNALGYSPPIMIDAVWRWA